MAREYIVAASRVTLANQAVTVAFVNPGTSATLEFLRAWLGQSGTATSENRSAQLSTQVTAFPTLTSATPAKTKLLDPASVITGGTAGAAGTSGVNASAEGAGAKTVVLPDNFNVLNGWLWVPTPAETLMMNAGASSGLGLHLPAAPTSLSNWSGGLVFRELV